MRPRRNSLTGRPSMYNCTAFVLLGPRCVVALMVCLAIYPNRSERHLCRSSADCGTEADVPPNRFPAASLIIAATVVGLTVLTAVLSAQTPHPRLPAPTGRLRFQFRPPAPNPGATDGCSRVLTVNLLCLPTICKRLLVDTCSLLVVIPIVP